MLTSHAEQTTTDNLLNNNSFTTDTSGWELSDNNQDKVKRDPNTYSDSASKSVRFRYQGGNINQDVDISTVPKNYIVKEVNIGYQSIGCGNTGSQWCTAGADDTVTSTITLSSTDTTEIINNVTAVPYEDGWSDYSFTEEIANTFNTNDLDVNLNIAGDDTGNSSNWYGPIVDNISFTFTIEEYIAPVVEQIIIPEPIIIAEPVVVEEPTLIEGLNTEIVTDVILEPTTINVELPDLPKINMEINMPEISVVDVPELPEMPVEVPEIEVVEEIQEIEVNEPIEELAEVEIEEPEELQDSNMEEDIKEINNDNAETEINEKGESQNEEKGKINEKTNGNSKLSKSKSTKGGKKNAKKENKKTVKVTKTNVTSKNNAKESVDKNTRNVSQIQNLVTIVLPQAYLQKMTNTITIQENISLTQEMIYEQDITAFSSNVAWDRLYTSANDSWNNLDSIRPVHSYQGYGR